MKKPSKAPGPWIVEENVKAPELLEALVMAKQTIELYPPLVPGDRQEKTLQAIESAILKATT
jgi:hypothetical protein